MRGESILLVDDERLIRWSLSQELTKAGFEVLEAENVQQCFSTLKERHLDIIILDQMLPDGTGIDVLKHLQTGNNAASVIMLTAIDKSDVAVQAMKLGACDYVTKPIHAEELLLVIEKVLESTRLRRQVAHYFRDQETTNGFLGMIGTSEAIKKVFSTITKIAQSDATTVLITGESGTGKELAARAVHSLSARHTKPLITINFSALTESLIESELFGHEKGAFTDATMQKKGLFELAHGGTIFLDEIGDVSPRIQVKLLRVIEQKIFQRVGGVADISVDVRVIAATNRILEERIAAGTFREDLYYRLNIAPVTIPPIRERGDDCLLLAEHVLQEFNLKFHKHFRGLSDETKEQFLRYEWVGNVREIRNVLERAVLLSDGELIEPRHVDFLRFQHHGEIAANKKETETILSLPDLEKQALLQALQKAEFNQSQAARLLNISRDTLRYRMKKYNLPGH